MMDQPTGSGSSPLKRFLGSPLWDGLNGLLAIVAFILSLGGLWELITGNVRVLLWLQATTYAIGVLVVVLVAMCMGSAYVLFAWHTAAKSDHPHKGRHAPHKHRYPNRMRLAALALMCATGTLALIITVGYNRWAAAPNQQTIVLIADFLDPNGQDSRAITRQLVAEISDTLHPFSSAIQVRTLGWPIENARGEGSADARRIGQLAKADIVIWGDYLNDAEGTTIVHFDVLNKTESLLEAESLQVYGEDQVQQVAAAHAQVSIPDAYAFNVALGDHLGALVAFASGLTLMNRGAYSDSSRFLDTASGVYGNPLAAQIEPAIHHARGLVYAYLENGNVALSELTAALDTLDPSSPLSEYLSPTVILSNRGNVRTALGDLAGAIRDFDEALRFGPKDVMTYVNRGAARSIQGDVAGAMSDFDEAIKLDPDFAPAYVNRGAVRADQGDLAGAIRDYDDIIKLDQSSVPAYYNRAATKYALGDFAGAIRDYDRVIDLDHNHVIAYINRGNARSDLGDLLGAISDYDKAIEVDQDYAPAYSNRAVVRRKQGDLAGALRDYNKAIELDPDYAAAYMNRGNVHSDQRDYVGAIQDFDQAIKLDPEYASAYMNRGFVRSAQHDFAGALWDYNQAIRFNPGLARAYLARADAYDALGDYTAVIADLERYLELAPTTPDRARVEKIIASIKAELVAGQ